MLGAVLENAARYARRRARVSGSNGGDGAGQAQLAVEDDGPGLAPEIEEQMQAGQRLDQSGPGHHGLGLIIARELVEATAGALSLERSTLGGLRVAMTWNRKG
ncbi:MAG: ATP-binding protein [Sinobacteraceae bacterium]|nr:ATP-binding protein [Nevskiaceae bacterium]